MGRRDCRTVTPGRPQTSHGGYELGELVIGAGSADRERECVVDPGLNIAGVPHRSCGEPADRAREVVAFRVPLGGRLRHSADLGYLRESGEFF